MVKYNILRGENMTKRLQLRLVSVISIFLALSLIVSVFAVVKLNGNVKNLEKAVSQNEATVSELEQTQHKLEESLKASQEENDSLKEQNSKLEKANSKLKKEKKALRTKLKELKAQQNSEEAANAVKTSSVAGQVKNTAVKSDPVPQNPKPEGKVCYLTFDDGPTANTLKILKVLEKYDVKATFFVIDTAESKLEYIKQVYAAGHAIGLHSSSHNYAKIYSSTKAYFADLNKLSKRVEQLIGVKPKIVRFPGGSSNTISKNYKKGIMTALTHQVTDKGYTYIDWNLDSCDASAVTVSRTKLISNVLKGAKGMNSVCVLMHDAPAKTTTVDALPAIIKGLKKQGYRFEVLTEKSYGYHHTVSN